MLTPPIRFSPEGHVYRDSNGVRVPSVTQIMEACGLQDFSKVDKNDLAIAQERGTKVHRMCQLDDEGLASGYRFPQELEGFLSAWRAAKTAFGAVILATEQLVWHPFGYAGTFDSFIEDRDEVYWLLDRKTGPEHPAHEVQLGAYWPALQISAREILPPNLDLSKVRFASVHLKGDGSYKIAEHDAKKGWATFLSCLGLYGWKINHGLLKAA